MKNKIAFSILLWGLSLSVNAQYRKMPLDTNHYWHESFYYFQGSASYNCEYEYHVNKDTLIATKTYKKIVRRSLMCNSSNTPYSPEKAFLREDTILKRVIILDNTLSEKILYNFNKSIGDTAQLYDSNTGLLTYTLNIKDSAIINDGLYHKRYSYYNNTASLSVIEGVGGQYGLITPYFIGLGTGINLICLGKKNPAATIYHTDGSTYSCAPIITSLKESNTQNKNDITVFPNPGSGQIKIKSENLVVINSIRIHDLLGNEFENLPSIDNVEHTLNLINMASGVYVITIQYGDRIVNRKFIKN